LEANFVEKLHEIQYWLMLNHKSHKIIYVIGILILLAYLVRSLTEKYRIPSVVGYIILGTIFSVSVIDKLPFLSREFVAWYSYLINSFNFITVLAVSFISFTIGTSLSLKVLHKLELEFALIVLFESIGAFILVAGSMLLLGQPLFVALLLGTIATATAPAATVMALKEYSLQGTLSATLMVVLALDEAIALIIFAFMEPLALISVSPDVQITIFNVFIIPSLKIISSIGIGIIIGYLSQNRMAVCHSESRKVLLILATVFGVSALTIYLDISPLIANLFVGFAYRNFAKKRLDIADKIDILTVPLFAAFFILAGTKIQITNLANGSFLLIAIVYTVMRIAGKMGGANLGAKLSNASPEVSSYIGYGLLPQIGVAIDLAFIIQRDFIHLPGDAANISILILNIILFTSFITETLGPLATEFALIKSGEIKKL